MSSKSFNAVWGKRVWLITGSVVSLGIGVGVALPFILLREDEPVLLSLLPTVVMCLIVGSTALFVVRGFELNSTALHVRRSFWTTKIPLYDLQSFEVDPTACKGAIKTIGNDGLFAMHGWFYSKRLGKFRAFVTNPADAVVLRFTDRIIVISPEKPKSFINELNRQLKKQGGGA